MAKNIFQLKLLLLLTMFMFSPLLVHSSKAAGIAMDELFPSHIDQHAFTAAHPPSQNESQATTFERLKTELIAKLDQLSHFLEADHLEDFEKHLPPQNPWQSPKHPEGGCPCNPPPTDPSDSCYTTCIQINTGSGVIASHDGAADSL